MTFAIQRKLKFGNSYAFAFAFARYENTLTGERVVWKSTCTFLK